MAYVKTMPAKVIVKCNTIKKWLISAVPIIILMFLLMLPSVAAAEGCFIHPDSTFYCTNITPEKAAQECSFYDNCVLPAAYFENVSCADYEKFSQCQKYYVKAPVRKNSSANASGEKYLLEKRVEWCSPGCCQFPYFGGSFCGYKENKWKCETEAKNKEVASIFLFFR